MLCCAISLSSLARAPELETLPISPRRTLTLAAAGRPPRRPPRAAAWSQEGRRSDPPARRPIEVGLVSHTNPARNSRAGSLSGPLLRLPRVNRAGPVAWLEVGNFSASAEGSFRVLSHGGICVGGGIGGRSRGGAASPARLAADFPVRGG